MAFLRRDKDSFSLGVYNEVIELQRLRKGLGRLAAGCPELSFSPGCSPFQRMTRLPRGAGSLLPAPAGFLTGLEDQLESKLDLPGWCLGLVNLAGSGNWVAALIEYYLVINRRRKVGMIEYVEGFGPELRVEPFRDGGVLYQRSIDTD